CKCGGGPRPGRDRSRSTGRDPGADGNGQGQGRQSKQSRCRRPEEDSTEVTPDSFSAPGGAMLDSVLKVLESFAARTAMYVHPVEIAPVQSYLHGLQVGCSLGGLVVSRDEYVAAAATRGWEFRATGIVWHMRQRRLDDMAVIRELIAVQAEAL